jgi:Abnormal spindle-like microcephaly-assoc'd, ASPM-SPD-2-Hydin
VTTVVIANPSIAPLSVADVTTIGDFAVSNACGLIPQGENCSFSVSFTPTQRGIASGSAVITTTGFGHPQTMELIGEGTVVEILPRSLNFGTQSVGIKSHVRKMALQNTSDLTLHISNISITGSNAADFSQTNDCGSVLRGGTSCTLMVTFKPSGQGSRVASLAINDDGGASPQTPSLTGTGR